MLLNPTPAALSTTKIGGFTQPITIQRQIDPNLLKLNSAGYLNGHTPFSAYLTFLSLLTASIHGLNQIITSNESSAGEASLAYHDLDINHQYSKSFRFEQRFRQYATQFLTPHISYFSFLRPISELQIAALFAQTTKFDQAFASCNVTRNVGWCGTCPKCAFVYLVLSAFMDQNRLKTIFGPKDFLANPQIIQHLTDLVGLGDHKPFDCVGTTKDSQDALALALSRHPHPSFVKLAQQLKLEPAAAVLTNLKTAWDPTHFLPYPYETILKAHLERL